MNKKEQDRHNQYIMRSLWYMAKKQVMIDSLLAWYKRNIMYIFFLIAIIFITIFCYIYVTAYQIKMANIEVMNLVKLIYSDDSDQEKIKKSKLPFLMPFITKNISKESLQMAKTDLNNRFFTSPEIYKFFEDCYKIRELYVGKQVQELRRMRFEYSALGNAREEYKQQWKTDGVRDVRGRLEFGEQHDCYFYHLFIVECLSFLSGEDFVKKESLVVKAGLNEIIYWYYRMKK